MSTNRRLVRLSEKALTGFSDKGNVRAFFSEFCEIQRKSPCRHAARTPKGHTCVTKGIFSDAHVAGKNIEFEFFDRLTNRRFVRRVYFALIRRGLKTSRKKNLAFR